MAVVTLGAVLASGSGASAASLPKLPTAKGPTGQVLTASVAKNLDAGATTQVVVKGKGYNTKLGIYVTFCVIPDAGKRPELCGPFDITGANNQSVWISSNPPLYAKLLVKPFGKGGTFKVTLPIQSKIGDLD